MLNLQTHSLKCPEFLHVFYPILADLIAGLPCHSGLVRDKKPGKAVLLKFNNININMLIIGEQEVVPLFAHRSTGPIVKSGHLMLSCLFYRSR